MYKASRLDDIALCFQGLGLQSSRAWAKLLYFCSGWIYKASRLGEVAALLWRLSLQSLALGRSCFILAVIESTKLRVWAKLLHFCNDLAHEASRLGEVALVLQRLSHQRFALGRSCFILQRLNLQSLAFEGSFIGSESTQLSDWAKLFYFCSERVCKASRLGEVVLFLHRLGLHSFVLGRSCKPRAWARLPLFLQR